MGEEEQVTTSECVAAPSVKVTEREGTSVSKEFFLSNSVCLRMCWRRGGGGVAGGETSSMARIRL